MAPARRPPSSSSSSSSANNSQPPPPPAPYQAPSFSRPFSRYPSFKQAEADQPDANNHSSARGISPDRDAGQHHPGGHGGLPPPPPPPAAHHSLGGSIPPPQRYHHSMPAPQSARQHANLIMRRPAPPSTTSNGYIGVPMSFSRGGVDEQAQEDSDEIPGDDDDDDEGEEHSQSGGPSPHQQPQQTHQHQPPTHSQSHHHGHQSAYASQQSFPGMPPSTQPPRQQSYPYSQHQPPPPPPSNGKHRKSSTSVSSAGSHSGTAGAVIKASSSGASGASPGAGTATSAQISAVGDKSSPPAKPTKKRDRISQACNFCRQRRMKCRGGRPAGANYPTDPGQPCDRCAEKGTDCSWSCYSESGRQATTARKKSRLSGVALPESLTGVRQGYDGGVAASGTTSGASTPAQTASSRQKTHHSPGEPSSRGNRNAARRRTLEAAASAHEESHFAPETQSQDSQALAVHAALQHHLALRAADEEQRPQPLTMELGAPSGIGREALQPRQIVPDGASHLKRKRSDQEASAALMMMPHIDPALGGSGGTPTNAKRPRVFDQEKPYSSSPSASSLKTHPPAIHSRGVVSSRKAVRDHKMGADASTLPRRRHSVAGGVNLSDLTILSFTEEQLAHARNVAGVIKAKPESIIEKNSSFERFDLGPDSPMSAPAAAEDYLEADLLSVSPLLGKLAPRGTSQRRRDLLASSKVDILDLDGIVTPHEALGFSSLSNGSDSSDKISAGYASYSNPHIDPHLGSTAAQVPPLSQTSFKASSDSQLEPWFDIGGAGMPSQQSQHVASQHYSHHPYHQSPSQPYGYPQVASQSAGWPYAAPPTHSPQQQRATAGSVYAPYSAQLPYAHYRYTSSNPIGSPPASYPADAAVQGGENFYPVTGGHGEGGGLSQLADMSLARFGNLTQQSQEDATGGDDERRIRRSSSVSSLDVSQAPISLPASQANIFEGARDPLIEHGKSQSESQSASASQVVPHSTAGDRDGGNEHEEGSTVDEDAMTTAAAIATVTSNGNAGT